MVNIEEIKIKANAVSKQLQQGRKNKTISLKQAYDLLDEFMKIAKDLKKTDIDEEMTEELVWVIIEYLWISNNACLKWKRSKTHPTEQELKMIKRLSGKYSEIFSETKEQYPSIISDKLYLNLKEEEKSVEDFIKAEENYQKSPSDNGNDNGGNGTSNNDNSNSNDNANGSNGRGNNSSADNSELEKQIKDLQTRIKELENKQQQEPNSVDSQQAERKKARLERELEELERAKENNQKQRRQNYQNGKNEGNFPYGLVIGGGMVIFFLVVAVVFLWQKNRRKS